AWSNLGNALKDAGRIDDALAATNRALSLRPDSADIHNNLGNLLRQTDQLDESIAHLRQALRIRPDFPEALSTLGGVFKDSGLVDQAIECFRQSLAVRPIPQAADNLLFALHHASHYDARQLFDEHQKWNQQFAHPLAIHVRGHDNDRAPGRRIRVGYVSPDLSDHPVGRFLLPLLQNHDHGQIEVICYTDTPRPDAITQSLRTCSDAWHSTLGLSDEEVAARVRRDRIDILVDLAMHTRHNRLLMFARKPAPVQATYLAYSGTTGLETMDYRLTDPYLDPPGVDETSYVEKTIRLPHTFWCYQGPVQAPDVAPLPALARGYVTFGSFNQFAKVSGDALAAWAKLLKTVPGSRLKLHAAEGTHRQRTLDEFAAAGVDVARIEFVGRVSPSQYFGQYNGIDIALDTFPYPGGTTTCDALWMGVPVVCLPGGTSISRGGLSVLSNVGLAELAARDVEEYVALAANHATDLNRLSNLRASMRDRMRASPLMDAVSFARGVESAYRTMWRQWCERIE
ncbi:MAG TPA: tetratricopeptide repeat protein, partial [Tepidisphaeraceae bacterium]